MGSQPTKEELAYIAGFLDGDGSIMLQLKKRSDSKRGWRLMATICLYQDSRHEDPLYWMRQKFGIGYISHRNDGMTELRINGFKQVRDIIAKLEPYLRFKKKQAKAIRLACEILCRRSMRLLTRRDKESICKYLQSIQENNYTTRHKKSSKQLRTMIGLTP